MFLGVLCVDLLHGHRHGIQLSQSVGAARALGHHDVGGERSPFGCVKEAPANGPIHNHGRRKEDQRDRSGQCGITPANDALDHPAIGAITKAVKVVVDPQAGSIKPSRSARFDRAQCMEHVRR